MSVTPTNPPPYAYPLVDSEGKVERGWTSFLNALAAYGQALKSDEALITSMQTKIKSLEDRVAALEAK